MSDHSQSIPIAEKWWHRLFRVVSVVLTIIVSGSFGMYSLHKARIETCVYSFQPEFGQIDQRTFLDFLFDYKEEPAPPPPSPFSCYPWVSAGEFIDKYTKALGNSSESGSFQQRVQEARRSGYTDEEIATHRIQRNSITFRLAPHWDARRVLVALATMVAIAIATFAGCFLIYKTTLYVVYGRWKIG